MNNAKPTAKKAVIKRPVNEEETKEIFRSAIGSILVDGNGIYIYMNGKIVIVRPEGPLPTSFKVKDLGVSIAVMNAKLR